MDARDEVDGKGLARAQVAPARTEAASARADAAATYVDLGGVQQDAVEAGVESLREEARAIARADAESGVPGPESPGPTQSELEIKDRCIAFFERWYSREKGRLNNEVTKREEAISDKLGKVELGIDRFQRTINELIRLKARFSLRRQQVTEELNSEGQEREQGIPTRVYLGALVFLGLVEFFANAPVFSTLLPRDPLTERQISLLTEMSQGWWSGLERVGAHIIFRPDAALLAAGVITFLCVLAHFFGHSLRDLVMQGEREERRHTVHGRSVMENIVPIVLSAVGLVLVLGVLFEARRQLGEVGEERYVYDMSQVVEMRREAGFFRVDGEILQANELTNRAEDMEIAASELREYSQSMARMNFPILLLNLTLVLCAISAAYFHRRDARREQFNETPFEDDRRAFVLAGEQSAQLTAELLSDVVKDIRGLKSLTLQGAAEDWRSVVHHLESVFATYRAENGRVRRMDTQAIAAFRTPIKLGIQPELNGAEKLTIRDPEDYERERAQLASRFQELRAQFNEEATSSW
jgi:hypothetical protein